MEAKLEYIEPNIYRADSFEPVIVARLSVVCESREELEFLLRRVQSMDIRKEMGQALVESESSKTRIPLKNDVEPIQEFSTIKSLEV